jgi:hypothetical protein
VTSSLPDKPPWLVATTKHENLPLPHFGKGGMGGFSYKLIAEIHAFVYIVSLKVEKNVEIDLENSILCSDGTCTGTI